MAPQHPVVSPVEVAHQRPFEIFPQQFAHYLPTSALARLEVALRRAGKAPQVAVLSPFSPACLVPMHHWAPPELLDEPLSHLLGLAPDQVQDAHDLPHTHSELVEGRKVNLDSSDRQPLHLPHGSYHGHRLGAHPTPSHHLPGKIPLGHVGLTTC